MPTPSTIGTISLQSTSKLKSFDFDSIGLSIASSEEVLSWSYGEVLKPETINYRSRKPERDGLFCQKIFGPVKDWQCACGKYKKLRYKGIVCDRCGVEITRRLVRRKRFGHISLVAPVAHIWFLRGMPSKIGLILGMTIQSLEKVVYFANFIITDVKEELKEIFLKDLLKEYQDKKKEIKQDFKINSDEYFNRLEQLTSNYKSAKNEILKIKRKNLLTEVEYRDFSLKYGHIFEADIGAESILSLLATTDLNKLFRKLKKEEDKTRNPLAKKKIARRARYVQDFIKNKISPANMILNVIPVIPPELRPLVPLDGGRFASSDLNDLYRRVINRNNRLKRLYELRSPEVILRNEKRMLQEAVDALFDNNMRAGKTTIASTGQKRPLKSLADILKGKQGRFRKNLLGKRVDYSGRSVIVVGPKLKLHQCGLPKIMAIELFKPFVASKLIEKEVVHNVKSANRLIEDGQDIVWDILEEVTKKSYVLLNRAPTLHRLGIQAFQPVLIEGKAIQIHPLVCAAFNADFDGDQMAVYLPITAKGQTEAKEIMLSTKNILKPADGKPVVAPTQDIVWGAYHMTFIRKTKTKEKMYFSSMDEAILAHEANKIDIQDRINIKVDKKIIKTSLGRLIFNSTLPKGFYDLKNPIRKKDLKEIIVKIYEQHGEDLTVETLDKIKKTAIFFLTLSGLSWGMDDLPVIPEKEKIIKLSEKEIVKIQSEYDEGLLSEEERYLKSIDVWLKTKDEITDIVVQTKKDYGPAFSMVQSGARGSWVQLSQMFGMRGIVSSPSGRLIELPIKSSFKEGFSVLEFFISTHGSRKGTADTALRTAEAGYLTRRMVDVAQDIVVSEEKCSDKQGYRISSEDNKEVGETWEERLTGRTAARDIINLKTKKVIVKTGEIIGTEQAQTIAKIDPEEVFIYSLLTCKLNKGVCARCYGNDLAYNKKVKQGTPVGIIAAQSIGEPGTQLTLRTFHTGGVAGEDITQGLPRVEEIFETRAPKKKAIISNYNGTVRIKDENNSSKKIVIQYKESQKDEHKIDDNWKLKVTNKDKVSKGDILATFKNKQIKAINKGEIELNVKDKINVIYNSIKEEEYEVGGYRVLVKDKEKINKGQLLTDGNLDLKEVYKLKGKLEVEKYIFREIQYIYSSQGQKLNDKHIEIIIKQMFSRVRIIDAGDTEFLIGEIVSKSNLAEVNDQMKAKKKAPAKAKELLTGITKVSLSTDSWLSSASFQQTSRVLIDAAISQKVDNLKGLKENVIIGRLIPVGTGYKTKK
ncbi:DNA-directed RNA polymerase subunit beta' [Patescibacteria group bacterium]|nr:DNA-directed RNA polymerase subunit beta' [Patescibacteria group bacterium]